MRVQITIFPHPLDARPRFFAVSLRQGEKPSGVGKIQRFATAEPWRVRAKYLKQKD
jgi:hypothetical protein